VLLIALVFCVVVFGGVRVTHRFSFLCYVFLFCFVFALCIEKHILPTFLNCSILMKYQMVDYLRGFFG
jgi:hypothetical protein